MDVICNGAISSPLTPDAAALHTDLNSTVEPILL